MVNKVCICRELYTSPEMSTTGQNTQLQQELQNELITTNQLLNLISAELQKIKQITSTGGVFETSLIENASLVTRLANLQQINIENLPPFVRNKENSENQESNT